MRTSLCHDSFTFYLSFTAGVTVLEGPIYAVGGHDGWSYLNTVERWDPQSQQWTFVASMSIARSTVGVAALNGKWVDFLFFLNLKKDFEWISLKITFSKLLFFKKKKNLFFKILGFNFFFKFSLRGLLTVQDYVFFRLSLPIK